MANAYTVLAVLAGVIGIVLIVNATVIPLQIVDNIVGVASGAFSLPFEFASGAGGFVSDAYCTFDDIFFNILPGCTPLF